MASSAVMQQEDWSTLLARESPKIFAICSNCLESVLAAQNTAKPSHHIKRWGRAHRYSVIRSNSVYNLVSCALFHPQEQPWTEYSSSSNAAQKSMHGMRPVHAPITARFGHIIASWILPNVFRRQIDLLTFSSSAITEVKSRGSTANFAT